MNVCLTSESYLFANPASRGDGNKWRGRNSYPPVPPKVLSPSSTSSASKSSQSGSLSIALIGVRRPICLHFQTTTTDEDDNQSCLQTKEHSLPLSLSLLEDISPYPVSIIHLLLFYSSRSSIPTHRGRLLMVSHHSTTNRLEEGELKEQEQKTKFGD